MKKVVITLTMLAAVAGVHAQSMNRPMYKPGDAWVYSNENALTHLKGADSKFRIAEAGPSGYRVIGGDRQAPNVVWDLDGSPLSIDGGNVFTYEKAEMQWPLEVGKKWQTVGTVQRPDGVKVSKTYDVEVLGYEQVETPAGNFMAFKVRTSGWHNLDKRDANNQNRGYKDSTDWWSPDVGRPVRTESRDGGPQDRSIRVLKSFKRQ